MAKEDNKAYVLQNSRVGEVQLADDVIAVIAGMAATEVEGVDSMAGNITNALVSKLGMQNLSKGVKTMIRNNKVHVDLALNLQYGYNVMEVSERVQDRVRSMVENMTGFSVSGVNIRVVGVEIDKK